MKKIDNPQIVNFDTKKIRLKEIFYEIFLEQNIQKIIEKNSNEKIYKYLYSAYNEIKFQKIYRLLLKDISNFLKLDNFFFQRIPSFRIHRKDNISVYYHNDIWYGHGKDVINVWIPITKTNEHNTIWVVNEKDSIRINNDFIKRKLGINDINELAKNSGSPQIVDYGDILFFKTSWLHGSEKNKSNKHRLSFDIRILPKGKSPGSKPINEYYLPFNKVKQKTKKTKECFYFIYKKNFFLNNLSHVSQREIINTYCLEKNLILKQEETEMHGVEHYPNLHFFLNYNKNKIPIVFTSIFCFPNNSILRKELFKLADKKGIDLHFALENFCFPKIEYKKINEYYKKFYKIYNELFK